MAKLKELNGLQEKKIADLVRELHVVDTLKADMDQYNTQLGELDRDLDARTRECEALQQQRVDLGVLAEHWKAKCAELEQDRQGQLDWKGLYEELRGKTAELRRSPQRGGESHQTSPLRSALDSQTEVIRLKEQNLGMFSELTDLKERVNVQGKALKKKDTQIEQLRELLTESDKLRDELLESQVK